MGANFGGIYLRGPRRRQVGKFLEQWAVENDGRCLLAPYVRGWLAVYPHNYGCDDELPEHLASAFGGIVLHVFVHDDSLMGYSYYRDGRLVDEYCSDPEYFDDVPPAEMERVRGRPHLLADLLPDKQALGELEDLLHPPEGTLGFAGFELERFARLLGLPNACTSYEYLMEDGWIERITRIFTIRGLWRFRHIPSLRPEKKARRERLARRAELWQELKQQGRLLAYEPGRVGWLGASEPRLCPNPAGNGFYMFFSDSSEGPQELAPPWQGPAPTSLETEPSLAAMAVSPSRRWLAIGHGYDPGHTELWDAQQGRKQLELPTQSANAFNFSADESRLMVVGAGELYVYELPSGNLLKQCRIGSSATTGVFDPSGRFALLVASDELALVDWQRGKRVRRWKLGQRVEPPAEALFMREGLAEQLAALTPEDIEAHVRKMAGQLRLPDDQLELLLGDTRQQHRRMMAMLESDELSEQVAGVHGSEMPTQIRFTRDGQYLLCATSQGVRVYRWAEFPGVLSAMDSAPQTGSDEQVPRKEKGKRLGFQFAPQPVLSVEGEAYREEGEEEHYSDGDTDKYIYALAYDDRRQRVIYGGLGGAIGSLDLQTGEHRTLMELPGRVPVMQLALSGDGTALACSTLPQFYRDTRKLAPEVCVWDYRKLSQ